MLEYTIGVDLGGTNLRAAVMDRSGKLLDRVAETHFSPGRETLLTEIVGAIVGMRTKYGATGLVGIGIGVPGFISFKEGVVRNANNLAFIENFPIRDEIEHRLGAAVILENDANAAALGEKWMGAGKEVDDLVLFTLGTGVGGGIIANGRVIRGFLGMAGELGHLVTIPNGNPCGCGSQGCVEKHASATAVTAMAKLLHLGDNLSSKDVYDMAAREDGEGAKARDIWRVFGETLGGAVAILINTFNFPLYLIGGGVLGAWDRFAPAMMRAVEERSATYRLSHGTTRIEQAKLGNDAGLYGAAYLPWIERRTVNA